MRGARFGSAPNVVVDGRDAERDVEVGATRELAEYIDVADDHRPARDHRRRVREIPQSFEALAGELITAFGRLVRIGGGADDDGFLAPRLAGQLPAQHTRDVDLDADCAPVAVVRGPVGAELEGAHVAEGTAVLAAGVRIQRPVEAHAFDPVQG